MYKMSFDYDDNIYQHTFISLDIYIYITFQDDG